MKIRFWSAFALSAFGYEITFFAMTLLVFNRSRNPLEVGIFTALTVAPKLLAPLVGAAAAKTGGRRALTAACGAAGLLVGALGFVQRTAVLWTAWFVISCLFVLISNVRTTLMVDIVGPDRNGKGNAAVLTILNAVRILVPALGAFASAASSPRLFFLSIGSLYGIAACLAWASEGEDGAPRAGRARVRAMHPFAPFLQGARGILASPDLSFLGLLVLIRCVFLGLQTSLFVVYVKTALRLGDAEYGYFMTSIGVGSVAGSLLGAWMEGRRGGRLRLVLGLCAHCAGFAALGQVRSLGGAMALMGGSFAVFYATLVSLHSLRDRATPQALRGSVYGTITAVGVLPTIISMVAGSSLISAVGIQSALLVCGGGALALVAAAGVMFDRARQLARPHPGSGLRAQGI